MGRTFIALVLAAIALAANGQDVAKKPSADDMKAMMDSSIAAMAPMMAKMSEGMIEAQLSMAEKPDTARRIAAFKKNLYEELQRQGFSKSQAMTIVVTTAPPAAYPGQR